MVVVVVVAVVVMVVVKGRYGDTRSGRRDRSDRRGELFFAETKKFKNKK